MTTDAYKTQRAWARWIKFYTILRHLGVRESDKKWVLRLSVDFKKWE